MENNNVFTNQNYPWYDDRVEMLYEEEPVIPETYCGCSGYDTPKKIYEYLDKKVWKQEEAKKAASVISYNCFQRGIKSNAMFVGPTGCGKTHIWRCLKQIFPDRIEIVDGSNLSQDGWKGNKKWTSLLQSPIFRSEGSAILVIDEADKMLSPKFAGSGENVSHNVQAEGLTMLEGTNVKVKKDSVTYEINTSRISFVLCGAFSVKAADMARKERGRRIGFGAASAEVKAYARPLAEEDLIEFGVMSEFMGRIQRIVNLEPMTVEDYYRMTDGRRNVLLQRVRSRYQADIRLTAKTRRELAEAAYSSGLGIRGMENRIQTMLDEAIFEDCGQRRFEF